MTRSSGPSRQAPQWQQQRAVHDQDPANQQYDAWQQLGQGGYHDQNGAPDSPFGAQDQGFFGNQPQPQPQFGRRQQPPEPSYPVGDVNQPPVHGGQHAYTDFGGPTGQPQQPFGQVPDQGHQGLGQFDTPTTQPPSAAEQGNYPQFGQNEAQAYEQLRPSAFDHEPNTGWQQPLGNDVGGQPGPGNAGLYDFGNYMPAGSAQTARPQFGDPDYVPPQQEWDVNSGFGSQAPGNDFRHQQPDGYNGLPQNLQSGAVTQHEDGYADESDEDYDDYYDEEEGGTGRKLIIAGALVSAIVVGGGFAYGYNTLFGDQTQKGETPVVAAASGAAKEQPANAGGKTFDNKDSKLLGKLGGAGGTDPDKVGNRVREVPTLVVGPDGRLVVPEASDSQKSASQTPPVEPAQQQSNVAAASPVPGMIVSGGSGLGPAPSVAETRPAAAAPATQVPPVRQELQPQVQSQQPAQIASAAQAAAPTTTRRRNSKFPPLPVRSGITKPQFTTASAVTPAAAAPAGVATANVTRVVPNQQQRTAPQRRAQPAAPVTPAVGSAGAGGNGFVAVLSTKRSRIDALTSFADLQQKYTSILSTKVPDVRRTDLTSRGLGVMYRAVVGPPGSKQAAGQVCNRLKAAGYSGCWVAAY